jgi:hypothetical protein
LGLPYVICFNAPENRLPPKLFRDVFLWEGRK